jgi:hypothetical protein
MKGRFRRCRDCVNVVGYRDSDGFSSFGDRVLSGGPGSGMLEPLFRPVSDCVFAVCAGRWRWRKSTKRAIIRGGSGWPGASGDLLKVCRLFRLHGAQHGSFASFIGCNDSSVKMRFLCWRYLFETIGCVARLTSDRLNAYRLACKSDSRLSAAMTYFFG